MEIVVPESDLRQKVAKYSSKEGRQESNPGATQTEEAVEKRRSTDNAGNKRRALGDFKSADFKPHILN